MQEQQQDNLLENEENEGKRRETKKMGSDQWVTIAIILVVALAIGLIIHAVAPGAIGNWFNNFVNNVLGAVPTA